MVKSYLFLILMVLGATQYTKAQLVKSDKEEAEYSQVLTKRSEKIIRPLELKYPSRAKEVTHILVEHYKEIGKIFDLKEAKLRLVKEAKLSNDASSLQKTLINLVAQTQLETLHRAFIGKLEARLTPEQVDQIKDGMTYNVLEVTYKSYLDMIPDLTPAQKTYIKANLIEAREYSMDGGSSKEKHWWFGKYKGRINNYLSREGYNLDQEREKWKERREAAAKKDK